jgi:CRISPR-associated protein (TIGR03986 family)
MAPSNQPSKTLGNTRISQNNTDRAPLNEPIPSPYNFVPLSPYVFFPDWAKQISMDVPFSEGISGTIQLKLTAKTPIYIRNGGDHPESQDRSDNTEYRDFYQVIPGGPYGIPGSSLKGMLRGVLEIASFGKIVGTRGNTGRVSDHRYAVRDLQNRSLYTDHITETINGAFKSKVQAAWLSRDANDNWLLHTCDFARVEQKDIESWHGGGCFLGKRGSAKNKYNGVVQLSPLSFNCGPMEEHDHSENKKLIYKKATKLGDGDMNGILVMTGQPAERDGRSGKKHMEFIFFNETLEAIAVPENIKKDFEFAHSELGENRKPNAEWSFWKKHFKQGKRVPVFVLFKNDALHSMGLAMMYRFPYKNSIYETISHTGAGIHLDESRIDLCEAIFGRVEDRDALRGRISIETAVIENALNPISQERTLITSVLSAPKPTFYPNYIKQNANPDGEIENDYLTYMDDNSEIRGWKRYLIRVDEASIKADDPPMGRDGMPNLKVATSFMPLPRETVFNGVIHLHNLLPMELGALIWAITWGGKDNLRHSLGMGKPYGFGSVKLEIVSADLTWCNRVRSDRPSYAECQKSFIDTMDVWYKTKAERGRWSESDQIRALRMMANPNVNWNHELRYPKLGNSNNEFAQQKRDKHSLLSPLNGVPEKTDHKTHAENIQKANEAPPANPVLVLIAEALSMKDKDLRKKLEGLQSITQAEYILLSKTAAKRPDAVNKKYLRGTRAWPSALEELKSRIKA